MKNVRVARRYAQALMTAAEQLDTIDRTSQDLNEIGALLGESRDFRLFVKSPVISSGKKLAIFKEILGPRISSDTFAFISLMTTKKRESMLWDVIEQFHVLRDKKLGIVNVDVTAAIEFSPSQQKNLETELTKYTRKKVRIRFSLDKSIKGGLLVRIGDTVLDASIKHQLERLKKQFIEGGPISN